MSDGRVDIGEVRPARFSGKMNLLGVEALPGMCPDAIVGSMVAEEIVQKFPEVRAAFPPNSVHFTSWASAACQIHSIDSIRNTAE